jgi:hypothetical protein
MIAVPVEQQEIEGALRLQRTRKADGIGDLLVDLPRRLAVVRLSIAT